MKWISLVFSLFLVGCAVPQRAIITPVSLSAISGDIAAAGTALDKAAIIAINTEKYGAQPHDTNSIAQVSLLASAKIALTKGQANIVAAEAKLANQATEMGKALDRLNYVEEKWALAKKVLWKWRVLAIGTWVAVGGFIAIKIWSKLPLPLPL